MHIYCTVFFAFCAAVNFVIKLIRHCTYNWKLTVTDEKKSVRRYHDDVATTDQLR